jgi:hypothetical protein
MTLHTCTDPHKYGLSARCARCRELAKHPHALDQAIKNRLASGHILTPLDLFAAQQLGVDPRVA